MHHRSDGIVKTAANLLFTSIGGQIQQGDTLGVWTYNQELHAGRLPLQRWANMDRQDICSGILEFLKKQKYENAPVFSSVRPGLDKVIKGSEFITIILLSSGEEPITGTPFDDQINQLYKNWREEQRKSRMPFVTVLRAKRGTITSFSVTPSPWQVEFPAWPAEPTVAKTTAAKTVVAETSPPKVQPSTVSSLIFTGKKPKPPETTNSTETATTTAQATPPDSQNHPLQTTNPSPESGAAQPSGIVQQKATANSLPAPATVLERKVEKAGLPQHAAEPTPTASKELASSSPTPKPEVIPPVAVAINRTNVSQHPQASAKSDLPPQEVATGIAAPRLLSTKSIWVAGLTVLTISCGMLIVLARRPRSQHISLITHSLERDKND